MTQPEDLKKWADIIDQILENPNGIYYYPNDGKKYKVGYTITEYPEYGKREIAVECKELNLKRFVTIKVD